MLTKNAASIVAILVSMVSLGISLPLVSTDLSEMLGISPVLAGVLVIAGALVIALGFTSVACKVIDRLAER